jgi:hypothetical protein
MLEGLGVDQIEVYLSIDIDITKLLVEFHVHINASLLTVRTMFSQNLTRKSDHLVVYVFRLLNIIKHNYNTR